MNVPVPHTTPAIAKEEKRNDRWLKTLVVLAVITLLSSATLVFFRFSDQAKQSTTVQAARRTLESAERQDCRSAYNAIRADVIEKAQTAQRESTTAVESYLLSRGSTENIEDTIAKLEDANARVDQLQSLPDMVDYGFTANGKKYPPCPTVS